MAVFLQYHDPIPPTKLHTYSHTSYVTVLDVFPLKNYSLFIIFWCKSSCQASPSSVFGFHFIFFSCFFCYLWISISHILIIPFNLNKDMLILHLSNEINYLTLAPHQHTPIIVFVLKQHINNKSFALNHSTGQSTSCISISSLPMPLSSSLSCFTIASILTVSLHYRLFLQE